jgi:hypothetical protein
MPPVLFCGQGFLQSNVTLGNPVSSNLDIGHIEQILAKSGTICDL